jgi:hypothetical protein
MKHVRARKHRSVPAGITLLSLFALSPGLVAQGWSLESQFRVSGEDTHSTFVGADYMTEDGALAFGGLGRTHAGASDLDLDTTTLSFGGGRLLNEAWRFTGWYERWGNSGDLTSDAVRMNLAWRGEPVQISTILGWRGIRLHAGAPARRGDGDGGGPGLIPVRPGPGNDERREVAEDFELRALSLGLRVRGSMGDVWYWSAGATAHDYSGSPEELAVRDNIEGLSASALTLAQGFLDRSFDMGVRRELPGLREVGISLARDRSAVDGRNSNTLRSHFLTPLGDHWDLELEVGRTRTDNFDPVHFGGVFLVWYR